MKIKNFLFQTLDLFFKKAGVIDLFVDPQCIQNNFELELRFLTVIHVRE
jgi:hypothetical protein